jgi:hypothetical protein
MTKHHTRIIAGPCVTPILNGDVARVVELPAGGLRTPIGRCRPRTPPGSDAASRTSAAIGPRNGLRPQTA